MKDNFIFTSFNNENINCFFDFYPESGNDSIITYVPTFKSGNGIVRKASISCQYNSLVPRAIKQYYYNLFSIDYKEDVIYHIIIQTLTISKLDIKMLEKLVKKHNNIRLYAVLVDSMDASSVHLNYVRSKLSSSVWTRVLTYDKGDAEKYGFTWIGYTIYSSWNFVQPDAKTSDCYYVGYNKGNRERLALDLYNKLESAGISARFDIVSDTPNMEGSLVFLQDSIPYSEVVSKVKSTNCIIEILQENQKTQSLRWFEAIAYNKKLLTNNKGIKNLPYYDERYMRYFESVDDIDLTWLSIREEIDYGYKGEFSPLKMIDDIKMGNT